MTISGKPEPDEVASMVVGTESNCIDASEADGLVDRHYAVVYRYAYRLTGCASAAEDITQDVFVKAIAHLHQLRHRDAERGWLMSITRREFMRWLREVANPAHGRLGPLDDEDVQAADRQPQRLDDKDWIQSALCLLNEDARVALLMYYFEDLSYAEIAQQLQIPIGTVMSRLGRGRQQLRQALDRVARPSQSSAVDSATAAERPQAKPVFSQPPIASLLPGLHPDNDVPLPGSRSGSKPLAQEAKHG